MAQEAFEAYGKSSPLPALPRHPFPPGYVPPPVSMGTAGSRHGTLSTMRRHGDYRQGATAAGDPRVRSLYHGEGREGPEGTPPPRSSQVPHPVLVSCLHRACDMRAMKGRRHGRPSPPHPPPPPRGRGMRVGGGAKKRPPPREQRGRVGRQRQEAAGRTTRPCPKRARAVQAPAGGPPWVRAQGRKGDDGSHKACPPCRGTGAAPRACALLGSCLRHACNEGKTTSPAPTHLRPPKGGG